MPCEYPYLCAVGIGMAVVLVVYGLFPGQRAGMLAGGGALLPFSLCCVLHEGSYWQTSRLGGLAWGLEDLLFTFSVGSMIAFIGFRIFGVQSVFPMQWKPFLKKYAAVALGATAGAALLVQTGVNIMSATIATQGVVGSALILLKKYDLGRSLMVAALYTGYYTVMLGLFCFLRLRFPGAESICGL